MIIWSIYLNEVGQDSWFGHELGYLLGNPRNSDKEMSDICVGSATTNIPSLFIDLGVGVSSFYIVDW